MSDTQRTLERELERLSPPRIPFDQLVRRRDRKRHNQRIRAGVLGIAIAIAVGWWGYHAIRSTTVPADDSMPRLTATEVLVLEQVGNGPSWDLTAQDPDTGEVRTIVGTEGIIVCRDPARCSNFVKSAEWSADGRWAAFDVSFVGPCGPTAGVWVTNGVGSPRQLTTPCDATPGADAIEEVWAWSPVGARLAYARIDGDPDELFVIDPSDGRRTSLGTVDGRLTDDQLPKTSALEWSPDRTRIAYADGGSIYVVDVDGGERSLLADSFVDVIDIVWSPDGTQILVHDQGRYRMQVMNADGSNLHLLLKGEDAGETEWSPDGDRILYQLSTHDNQTLLGFSDSEVWTVSPDGSNRIKVFDSGGCDMGEIADALPVWAANGTQVAYNACGEWVVANADGTGEARPIDELVHRSWEGGGLFTTWPPGE
jgi:hypothetical protein